MRAINLNRLACATCRKTWRQCPDRVRYYILELLGGRLVQCTYHEDIDTFLRREEAARMLVWINNQKVRLEKILAEEVA